MFLAAVQFFEYNILSNELFYSLSILNLETMKDLQLDLEICLGMLVHFMRLPHYLFHLIFIF